MEGCLLELRGVNRRVSSEFYLHNINLSVGAGEAHALVGRNASGKSTLFSVIMGAIPPDSGEVLMDGERIQVKTVSDMTTRGLILIGQNQKLFSNMTVCDNLFFGQELMIGKRTGVVDNKKMYTAAMEIFAQMGVTINPARRLETLSLAERQLITIARALLSDARVLLLDEPSTCLNAAEKEILYGAIRSLKAKGKAFLIISHDPEEVLATADRVSVMEGGELTRTDPVGAFDSASLIEAAYGIKAGELYRRDPAPIGGELLRLEHFYGGAFSDVSLTVRRGELVALTGDSRSGKTEVARALSGLLRSGGTLLFEGAALALDSPIAAVRAGIALACGEADEEKICESEELMAEGGGRRRLAFRTFCSELGRTFGPYLGIRDHGEYITGGNRQRELIERTLRKRAALYILCEPSAGVDVPARLRIYFEIGKLLQNGAGVLLVTSNPDEANGLADRIVTMQDGKTAD